MAINLLERLGGPFFPEWLIFFAEGNSCMFFAGGKNISAKNIKYLTVLASVWHKVLLYILYSIRYFALVYLNIHIQMRLTSFLPSLSF